MQLAGHTVHSNGYLRTVTHIIHYRDIEVISRFIVWREFAIETKTAIQAHTNNRQIWNATIYWIFLSQRTWITIWLYTKHVPACNPWLFVI